MGVRYRGGMEVITFQVILSFFLLFSLELLLGIDNIVFIAIVSKRLPRKEQKKVRMVGLSLALLTRLALLFTLFFVMHLEMPLFAVLGQTISGKTLLLLFGGIFLIGKGSLEMQQILQPRWKPRPKSGFVAILIQIILLDMLFSLDSIITAVGLVNEVWIMASAIIAATLFMIAAANVVAEWIDQHPALRLLAFSFLILIGVSMLGEGLGHPIPKGYIYFAMVYAVVIDYLGRRLRKKA